MSGAVDSHGGMVLEFVEREHVIARLAAHRADRDAFILAIPPSLLVAAARGLGMIREAEFFLDSSGTGDLLTAAGPGAGDAVAVTVALSGRPTVAVAVVPKRVAGVAVCAALGLRDMDDARDLRALEKPGEPVAWPRFLIDALERVDPDTVRRIEASREELLASERKRRTRQKPGAGTGRRTKRRG